MFNIPNVKMPEQLAKIPVAISEFSETLNEWLVIPYTNLTTAYEHFDEMKNRKPIMLTNFGEFLAKNFE